MLEVRQVWVQFGLLLFLDLGILLLSRRLALLRGLLLLLRVLSHIKLRDRAELGQNRLVLRCPLEGLDFRNRLLVWLGIGLLPFQNTNFVLKVRAGRIITVARRSTDHFPRLVVHTGVLESEPFEHLLDVFVEWLGSLQLLQALRALPVVPTVCHHAVVFNALHAEDDTAVRALSGLDRDPPAEEALNSRNESFLLISCLRVLVRNVQVLMLNDRLRFG